jgi:PKD repeat protein
VDLASVLVNLDVSLVTSFSDIGTKDTHVLDIDWDDGTVNSFTYLDQSLLTTTTDIHFYTAPGSYTVTVTVVDDDQGMFYVNRLLIVVNSVGAIQEAIASWGSLVVLNQSLLNANRKSWYAEKATEKMEKAIEIIDGDSDARDYYKCLKYVARAIKYLEKTEMSDSRPRIIIVSQLMLAAKSVAVQFLTEAHIMKETADEKDLEKMDKAERYFAEGNAHADVGNAHANAGKAVKSYSRSLRALPKVHKTKPSSKRTKSRKRGRKSNL